MGYALLAPSLFGVVTFLLLPMLIVAWLSVHRWDLLAPIRYVGLDNWLSVLTDPSFGTLLVVTALFIADRGAGAVGARPRRGIDAGARPARQRSFRTPYVLP